METRLESLIEKIKTEGVNEAKKLAQDIENKAKQQAKRILDDANVHAENITAKARQEAEKMQAKVTAALKQASRDVILAVKEDIKRLFANILSQNISQALKEEFVKELIVRVVDNWSKRKAVLEAIVSDKDKKKLEELLFSQFKEKLKDTIEIKVSRSVDKGFRIGIKGEEAHYDFTSESFLEAFGAFLNPAVAKVLDIHHE